MKNPRSLWCGFVWNFKKINKDNIYAATLLHDLGKIFEYNIDLETGAIEYVDTFKKDFISHSQYGYCLCLTNGFNSVKGELNEIILKMIAIYFLGIAATTTYTQLMAKVTQGTLYSFKLFFYLLYFPDVLSIIALSLYFVIFCYKKRTFILVLMITVFTYFNRYFIFSYFIFFSYWFYFDK